MTAEEVANVKGKFYELTAATSSSLTFTEVTGATEAYKPYVFVASETGTPFSGFKSKTVVAPKTCSYTVGGYTFVGSMKDATVPSGAYGFSSNAFKKAGTGVTIKAFRAYITSSIGNAPSMLDIDLGEGGTTGISTVESEKQEDDVMYNLQGQRVSGGHKGLVIKNGRKYFAK